MDNVPVHKSELGIVFQYYALFPHLTVLDNVTFPLIRRRMPNAKAKELTLAALATDARSCL